MKGSLGHLVGRFPGPADPPSILLGLGPFECAGPALRPADPQDLLSSGPADPHPPQPVAGWPCGRALGPRQALAPKLQILICFLTTRPQPDPCSWNLSLHCYILQIQLLRILTFFNNSSLGWVFFRAGCGFWPQNALNQERGLRAASLDRTLVPFPNRQSFATAARSRRLPVRHNCGQLTWRTPPRSGS